MKVLFLDIDGVICTEESCKLPPIPYSGNFSLPFRFGWDQLDKKCVNRINYITEQTNAKIVISSSWRLCCKDKQTFGVLTCYLHQSGIKADIIDKTPCIKFGNRGDEIKMWLNKYNDIDSIVIVDDNNDMGDLLNYLVQTSPEVGIDEKDTKQAIKILQFKF